MFYCTHPVTVKDDDRVSSCQIYPKSSCSSAQQEDKYFWICGELFHLRENKKYYKLEKSHFLHKCSMKTYCKTAEMED